MNLPSDFRDLEERLTAAGILFLTIGPSTDGSGWRANVRTDSSGWTTSDVHEQFEAAVQDAIDKRTHGKRLIAAQGDEPSLLDKMADEPDPLEGLLG